jgi:hypothetical protein
LTQRIWSSIKLSKQTVPLDFRESSRKPFSQAGDEIQNVKPTAAA